MEENTNGADPQGPDKLAIARYYTNGDMEKANEMVEGTYKDLYVLKLSLLSPKTAGACLMFFNHATFLLGDAYGVVSQIGAGVDVDPDIEWLAFEQAISECLSREEHDSVLVFNLLQKIKESITPELGETIANHIAFDELGNVGNIFLAEVFEELEMIDITLTVRHEEISSLDMELQSKSSMKVPPEMLEGGDEEPAAEEVTQEAQAQEAAEEKGFDQSKVKLIFDGTLILSPISGMHITGLVVKDKIKVKITDSSPKAIQIAKAFNAYNDGVMQPIIGEVASFRHKSPAGYKMFIEIAEGIYVRIDEDEENIKVEFVSPSPDRDEALQGDISKYMDKHVDAERKKNPQKQKPKKTSAEGDTTDGSMNMIIIVVIILIIVIGIIFGLLL
ncbi:MAG: hypothetical protein GY754_23590 [bacterium]|nr:hypothetical protein [bacterium]